jgi:hypothetical protein
MGGKQVAAFNKTKATVSNAILCNFPDPNKRFIIYLDASQKYTMGAMLVQEVDRVEQIISTFSWKFNDAQLKYSAGERNYWQHMRHADSFMTSSTAVTF